MITVGTDIEEFIANKAGLILSAQGLIGGSKDHPLLCKGGNLQEDCTSAEYAVDPSTSEDQFVELIRTVQGELESLLDSKGFSTVNKAAHEYPIQYLQSLGKQAITFGCDPEISCWSGKFIPPPDPYQGLRTSGAHVHYGYAGPTKDKTTEIAQVLDYVLGLWSLQHDPDTSRRRMYGKAGAYRIKPYGGEYRVLSNFWVRDEELIRQVYQRTIWAVENSGAISDLVSIINPVELQRCINAYVQPAPELYNKIEELYNSKGD